MQGGAKSGFHHVAGAADAVHEPALLHVRGRRSVVARQVAVAASSLTADGCFILDTYSTLFLWHGTHASPIEKANAVAVRARLHGARGGHCERVLVASAEAAQAATFWSALGGSEADVQPATADGGGGEGGGGAAAAAQAEAPLELFALAKDGAAPIRVAKGRLTRAALLAAVSATQRHTMLVDAGSEAMVWVARTAPSDERHGAFALADAFIAAHRPPAPLPPGWTAQKDEEGDTYYENDDPAVPSQWERPGGAATAAARVSLVHEGGETPEFVSLFAEWAPPPTFDFSRRASAGVAAEGAAARPVDFDRVFAASAAAAAAAAMPVETLALTTWAVAGTSAVEVVGTGEFYASDSYVVAHTWRAKGSGGSGATTVFYWLGRASTHVEQGHAALVAVEQADAATAAGRAAHQVRVVQGSEPPSFAAAFGGLLIVHAGHRGDEAAAAAPRLYHIKGTAAHNVRAVQVERRAAALNSGDAFVLLAGAASGAAAGTAGWAWLGKGCSGEERAAAARLATRLAGAQGAPLAEVAEGAEPEAFWSLLGGRAPYAASVPALPEGRAPRLFELGGPAGANEVLAFGQADLLADSVCLLDAAAAVFVWVGAAVSAGARSSAMDLAARYVAAAARAGRLDADVPVARVEAGAEPPEFTACFAGWSAAGAADAASAPDPFARRLAELAAQREAESARLAAGQAAREARNRAALARIQEKRAAVGAASGAGAAGAPAAWTRPLKKVAAV
jgi:villin 1